MLENESEAPAEQEVTQPEPEAKVEEPKQVEAEQEKEEQKDESEQPRDEKGRFKGVQDRINELTRARREAEREAAYWRELAKQPQEAQAQPSEKPTAEKFASYDEYVEALADWKASEKVREALAQQNAQAAREAQTRAQQAQAATFAERLVETRRVLPDFDDVVGNAEIQISRAVEQTILESDRGPELAYYLAKNPDIAQRLNGMSALAAAREIGKLEASLSAKPAPKVSKAPEPIKPIGSARSGNVDLASASMDEYIKMRQKQGASWARG